MDLKWLREMLERPGYSQAGLARVLNVHPSAINRMLTGEKPRRIRVNELAQIMKYLDHPPQPPGVEFSVIAGRKSLQPNDRNMNGLILYRTFRHEAETGGRFMLNADSERSIDRPSWLDLSENAFAFRLLDDHNAPVYKRRDLLIVDPQEPPEESEDHVFTADPAAENGSIAAVGCLIRITDKLWIIRQYAVDAELSLSRAEFPHAWQIIGRYRRR